MTARTQITTSYLEQTKLNYWVLAYALLVGTSKEYKNSLKSSGWLINESKTQYSFPVLARVVHACYFHFQQKKYLSSNINSTISISPEYQNSNQLLFNNSEKLQPANYGFQNSLSNNLIS